MQLCYCNSQKNFTKKCFKSTFVGHFSAFQDFQNEILFQYSKISYNNKVNFCELSDIFKSYFLNIFLDVGGPSFFSKVRAPSNEFDFASKKQKLHYIWSSSKLCFFRFEMIFFQNQYGLPRGHQEPNSEQWP